jgi:uncharacterized protein YyaL (SSP411 family)
MIIGLVDAYQAFGEKRHLNMALENAKFLTEKQQKKDGSLWHSYKDGKSTISAYLEDYSFSIEAFIKVYEVTANEDWLNKAKQLADYSIENFYDSTSGMFYFTNKNDAALIARKFEVSDNVIPSSNSSMAKGLFSLAIYFDDANYHGKTTQMLRNIAPKINDYLPGYSNWAVLLLNYTEPFYEVAITGEKAISFAAELQQDYVPNKLILMDLDGESALPLVQLKWTKGASTIFVCENKVCQLPVSEVSLAKAQILSE